MKYQFNNSVMNYKSLREVPIDERPSKRIAEGAERCADIELLCSIIGTGTKRRPVQDIAYDVMCLLDTNRTPTASDLMAIEGLGESKAAQILACIEFGRRFSSPQQKKSNEPKKMFERLRHYGDRVQENFIVLGLNGAFGVLYESVVSVGLVNRTLVHAREVFAEAIEKRATAIVLAHNHPSGNLEPSPDDLEVTLRMKKAGQILGIDVLDHIIFSSDDYYSMSENGDIL